MSGSSKKPARSSKRLAKKKEKGCNHASYAQISPKENQHSTRKVSHDASCHGEKPQNHQHTAGKSSSPASPCCPPFHPVSERVVEREEISGMSGKENNVGSNPEVQVGVEGFVGAEMAGREPSTLAQEGKKDEADSGTGGEDSVERAGVEPSMAAREKKQARPAGDEPSKVERAGRAGAEPSTAEMEAERAGRVGAESSAAEKEAGRAGRAGAETPSAAQAEEKDGAGDEPSKAGRASTVPNTAGREAGNPGRAGAEPSTAGNKDVPDREQNLPYVLEGRNHGWKGCRTKAGWKESFIGSGSSSWGRRNISWCWSPAQPPRRTCCKFKNKAERRKKSACSWKERNDRSAGKRWQRCRK